LITLLAVGLLCSGVPASAQDTSRAAGLASDAADALASAAGSGVRALVVGIDNYKNPKIAPTLKGAVADARDIAASLQRANVSDVTLLIDGEATRRNVLAALQRLAAEAAAGELVIITFAGHGAAEKERVAGSEADGTDEFLVMHGFGTAGDDTQERIVDDEVFAHLSRIADRGAEILLLVDTCHGGGMTKSVDPRIGTLSVRGLTRVATAAEAGEGRYFIEAGADRLTVERSASDEEIAKALPGLTFVGAVPAGAVAPEIDVPGDPSKRGAASYALARALDGVADAEGDRDGSTSRRELLVFLGKQVGALTGGRQHPVLEPVLGEALKRPVFKVGAAAAEPPPDAVERPIRVALLNAAPQTTLPATGKAALEIVATAADADLSWDATTGDVVDSLGGVLSYGTALDQLPGVADRTAAARRLLRMTPGRSILATLAPADKDYAAGDRFKVSFDGIAGRHLILLNLAGDGRLQFLLPRRGGAPFQVLDDVQSFDLVVEPPFGTDTLVAIATIERRVELEAQLRQFDGQVQPLDAIATIEGALNAGDLIGIAAYTTRP
jgi:hypothetical protein